MLNFILKIEVPFILYGYTQSIVPSAISSVVPDLPEVTKDILEKHLTSLGIETYDDVQFMEETDLLSALRPTQGACINN